ncbi:hypothetical protein VTO42DRAFT_1665 [Malbranchea cinnamomea]
MLGVMILVSLVPLEMIPKEVIKVAQKKHLSQNGINAVLELSPNLPSLLVDKLLVRFDEDAVTQCLGMISSQSPNLQITQLNILDLLAGKSLLIGLVSVCSTSPLVKSTIASLWAKVDLARSLGLGNSTQCCRVHEGCCAYEVCPVVLSLSRHRLAIELAALYVDSLYSHPVPLPQSEAVMSYILELIDHLKSSLVASRPIPSLTLTTMTNPALPAPSRHNQYQPTYNRDWKS